jgi:hypothetical protein
MLVTGFNPPSLNLIHTITLIPDLKEKHFQVFLFKRNV